MLSQDTLNELLYTSKSIVNIVQKGILLGEGEALPLRVIEDSR